MRIYSVYYAYDICCRTSRNNTFGYLAAVAIYRTMGRMGQMVGMVFDTDSYFISSASFSWRSASRCLIFSTSC